MQQRGSTLGRIRSFVTGFIAEEAQRQKGRFFLWTPVFIGFGIALYFSLDTEPSVYSALPTFLLCFASLLFVWIRKGEYFYLRTALLAMCLFHFGFMAAQYRAFSVAAPTIKKEIWSDVTGTVEDVEMLPKGARIILNDLHIEKLTEEKTPAKIRLRLIKKELIPTAGARVKLRAKLRPLSAPVIPSGFDFQRYGYFRQLGGVGFAISMEVLEEPEKGVYVAEHLRIKIADKLIGVIESESAAVAIALLTGEKKAIPDETRDHIRDSGLAHLLAISGLHVGLVAGVLFFSMRAFLALFPRIALYHPIKKYAAAFALTGIIFYTFLVGAPVSTQRACMMVGFVLVAVIFDRQAISLRLVAFAALVILILAPESLLSAGFQMSFSAVAALVVAWEWGRYKFSAQKHHTIFFKFIIFCVASTFTTLIAEMATAPFALYHFQQISMYGIASNLVAVPIMAFLVMPAGVLSLILMPLGLEGLSSWMMDYGIRGVLAIAGYVANIEGSVIKTYMWPLSAFISLISGLVFVCLWKGRFRLVGLFIAVSFCTYFVLTVRLPDILVSAKADLIAVREVDRNWQFSSLRKNKFTGENWQQALAVSAVQTWKESNAIKCDSFACHAQLEGKNISILYQPEILSEECDWADILISPEPIRKKGCGAKTIINWWDVWRNGSYAVYLEGDNVRVQSSNIERGDRPWSPFKRNRN